MTLGMRLSKRVCKTQEGVKYVQFIRAYKAEHIIVLTTMQSPGNHKSWNLPCRNRQVIFTVDKLAFIMLSKIM